MKTIEEVIKGFQGAAPGATVSIKGLVSSDDTVSDIVVTLLPSSGYREMQREDHTTLVGALSDGNLSEAEKLTAGVLIATLEKALTTVETADQLSRGPAYVREEDSVIHRLPSSPDAVYLLRLRREGEVGCGKPPKGDVPLQKFLLTRKLKLKTVAYVHAVKLQDGRFGSVEIV